MMLNASRVRRVGAGRAPSGASQASSAACPGCRGDARHGAATAAKLPRAGIMNSSFGRSASIRPGSPPRLRQRRSAHPRAALRKTAAYSTEALRAAIASCGGPVALQRGSDAIHQRIELAVVDRTSGVDQGRMARIAAGMQADHVGDQAELLVERRRRQGRVHN
jgi:hypothetical protein